MRAIFTEILVHENLFNTVVYGSNETHIIMHNLKIWTWNQLKFWKKAFFVNIFRFMPKKDVVRISDYSFKYIVELMQCL